MHVELLNLVFFQNKAFNQRHKSKYVGRLLVIKLHVRLFKTPMSYSWCTLDGKNFKAKYLF